MSVQPHPVSSLPSEGQSARAVPARTLAAIAVSGGLLAWVLLQADLASVGSLIADANVYGLGVGLLLILASFLIHAWRFCVLLAGVGSAPRFATILRVHLIGMALSTLLPAQLGLDVARVQMSRVAGQGRAAMLAVSLVDRIVGAASLSTLACGSWLLLRSNGLGVWMLLPPLAVLFASVLVMTLGNSSSSRVLVRLPGALESRVRSRLDSFTESFRGLGGGGARLAVAVAIAATQHLILALSLSVAAWSLHLPVAGLAIAMTFPLIGVVTMTIPVSINGIGVREAMFCLTGAAIGMSHEQGLALASCWFVMNLLSALPGVVAILTLRRRPAPH